MMLSYHWIDATSGQVTVLDGLRTPLGPALRSGEHRKLNARVQVPQQSGKAILRITLLHEHKFWFDRVAPESAIDLAATIVDEDGWTQDAGDPGVFARHKILNTKRAQTYIRFQGKHRPLMLICETVNICNHHCIICAYDSQTRKKQTMPMDLFNETVRQYGELGGGGLSLTPMVGDVFLDRFLPSRLEVIRSNKNIVRRLSVTTNAAYVKLYDDDELKSILGHFDDICISVYGLDAEEFLAMTKTPDYDLMRMGIERIFRLSSGRISLGFRCLKDRPHAEIQRWVRSIPSFPLASDRMVIHGNARQFANWGVLDTSRPLPFDAKWIAPKVGEKAQCGIPLLAMQVFSNGNVSFCPCDDFDNDRDLHLGNVMETSLAEMFNGPKARALWDWQSNGTPSFCRSCSFHRSLEDLLETPGLFENPLNAVGG